MQKQVSNILNESNVWPQRIRLCLYYVQYYSATPGSDTKEHFICICDTSAVSVRMLFKVLGWDKLTDKTAFTVFVLPALAFQKQ